MGKTPLVLIVRDGWGENPNREHDAFNAVRLAKTPVADRLDAEFPRVLIATSGQDVGLPRETMGNSEVGHQNLGAGRVVDQDSVRITKACREKRLGEIVALTESIQRANDRGGTVHLMGICSDAGVHGLLEHLYALLELCREQACEQVVVHAFTDGRDTGPFMGLEFVRAVQTQCERIGVGRIGSVIGRYYAMDRDNRWERVESAYRCLTEPEGPWATSGVEAVQRYYDSPSSPTQKGDEFITPTIIGATDSERRKSRIGDGDTVIFYNYRGDRPREIVSAFVLDDFELAASPSPDTGRCGFGRSRRLDIDFVMMTAYSTALADFARVAFPKPPRMENIAGEYFSSQGLTQFRCAETEKYAHVTFFFNDYRDEPFPGERREIIQSPSVSTYDQAPQMSAEGICNAVLGRLDADDCEDIFVVNFANGDMVGHTGSLDAAVQACETVDGCVGRIVDRTLARGGNLIVTADHGNAEQMWDPQTEAPHTAHTLYDVPLYVVGRGFVGRPLREGGRLADVVPTMLEMLGTEKPAAMTGSSLI